MDNQLHAWFQQPAIALAPMPIAAVVADRLVTANENFAERFGPIQSPIEVAVWLETKGFDVSDEDRGSLLRPQPRTQLHLQLPSKLQGGSPQVFRCEVVEQEAGQRFLYFLDDSANYHSRHQGLAQRQYLDDVLASTSFFLIRVDMQGRYTYANDSFLKTFGYDLETLRHTEVRCTVLDEDYGKMMEATMQSIAFPGKKIVTILRKPLAKKGEFISTQWEFVTLTDAQGRPTEVQCAGINISQQVATQERFSAAQASLQQAIERVKKVVGTYADTLVKADGDQTVIALLDQELQKLDNIPLEAPHSPLKPFNLPSYESFGG